MCTICTAVAPEAVFTRRTNEPTTARYPPTQDALSDHIQTRTRSSTACKNHDYTVVTQLRTDIGRGSGSILRTGLLGLSIASTSTEAQAVVDAIPPEFGEFFRGFFFAGTPDDTVHYLNSIIGSGYQYLVFFTADLFTLSFAVCGLSGWVSGLTAGAGVEDEGVVDALLGGADLGSE